MTWILASSTMISCVQCHGHIWVSRDVPSPCFEWCLIKTDIKLRCCVLREIRGCCRKECHKSLGCEMRRDWAGYSTYSWNTQKGVPVLWIDNPLLKLRHDISLYWRDMFDRIQSRLLRMSFLFFSSKFQRFCQQRQLDVAESTSRITWGRMCQSDLKDNKL